MKLTDKATLFLSFKEKRGARKTLKPPGHIHWYVDRPNMLTLSPSLDGLRCEIAASGPLGSAVVSVRVMDSSILYACATLEVDIVAFQVSKTVMNIEIE